jgi:hypothetical protein
MLTRNRKQGSQIIDLNVIFYCIQPRINQTRLSLCSSLRKDAAKIPCPHGFKSFSPGRLRESLIWVRHNRFLVKSSYNGENDVDLVKDGEKRGQKHK